MALIPIVLFCGRPAPRWPGRALDYVMLVFCAFTGPYMLFLLPVFVGSALVERKVRPRALFLGICLLGAAACVVGLLQFGSIDRIRGAARPDMLCGFVQLTFRHYFFPVLSRFVDDAPAWMVMVGALLVPVLLVVAARMIRRSGNRFARVSFVAGLLLFAATLVSYGRSPALPSPFAHGIRNFYLPMVCLLWSLIASTPLDARRVAAWVILFVWFAVQIPFIPESRVMPDQRWEVYAERLKSGNEMTIPITPQGWGMTLREKRD